MSRAAPPVSTGASPLGTRRERLRVDDCPGTLAPELVQQLQLAAVQTGTTRWLYPYDQTVFPRGIAGPVLQWSTPPARAVMLQLRSRALEYRGCFAANDAAHFAIPQDLWDTAAAQSEGGAADPLTIDLTIGASASVTRLPPLTATFALATLKGAVYYSTYRSSIASGSGVGGGVVMRVTPRRPTSEVFIMAPRTQSGACVGCHSVSATGGRMLVGVHTDIFTPGPGAIYDLSSGTPSVLRDNLRDPSFGSLHPEGSVYVTQGSAAVGNTLGMLISAPGNLEQTKSALVDARSGIEIADSGLTDYAYMPMFSTDGKRVAFNMVDAKGQDGHTLATQDYDDATHKFSNLKAVWRDPARYPGWPFFVPDVVGASKRVVFALGEKPDFYTQETFLMPFPGLITPHPSDLWWVDVDTGTAAPLARANADAYLPYGERDAHKNYYPTVSPVAAGGYFWLFFTSKRNYGNLFVTDTAEEHPEAKKIWVSALDVDAPPGSDPSHPAFFLAGQELESGNIRAFAALDVCRPEGVGCETGIDCCCGFCDSGRCACHVTTTSRTCAELDERCAAPSDCCDTTQLCIGGFCAERTPD